MVNPLSWTGPFSFYVVEHLTIILFAAACLLYCPSISPSPQLDSSFFLSPSMSEPEESPNDKSPPAVADEAQPETEESNAEVVEASEGEKSVGEVVHELAEEVTEIAQTVIADVKDFFTSGSEEQQVEKEDKTTEETAAAASSDATTGETSDPTPPPTTETTPPEKEEVPTNGINTPPDHRASWANCCGLLDLFHQHHR